MAEIDQLTLTERLKISCFAEGISVSGDAAQRITERGRVPLTIHEYATTGGVTFELADGTYLNAPFDDWYTGTARAELAVDGDGQFFVAFEDAHVPVARVLPLPGYLDAVDDEGRKVTEVVMSHADRIRLSPIVGCAYDCKFCDLPSERYTRRPTDQLTAALRVARDDHALPPRHVLISGGSPGKAHYDYFEDACRAIVDASDLPVDIMMSPRVDDLSFIDRVVDAGVEGFALNIEVFSEVVRGRNEPSYLASKARLTRDWFEATLVRAVETTGGGGRVRSLIIVGLEDEEETLAGVEFIAERGADPVLSPFRPARNTALPDRHPPSPDALARVLVAAREIAQRHGVKLGPRCVPCQHNTLTFPSDVLEDDMVR